MTGEGTGEEQQDTEVALDDAAAESNGSVAVPVIIGPETSLSSLLLLEPIARKHLGGCRLRGGWDIVNVICGGQARVEEKYNGENHTNDDGSKQGH